MFCIYSQNERQAIKTRLSDGPYPRPCGDLGFLETDSCLERLQVLYDEPCLTDDKKWIKVLMSFIPSRRLPVIAHACTPSWLLPTAACITMWCCFISNNSIYPINCTFCLSYLSGADERGRAPKGSNGSKTFQVLRPRRIHICSSSVIPNCLRFPPGDKDRVWLLLIHCMHRLLVVQVLNTFIFKTSSHCLMTLKSIKDWMHPMPFCSSWDAYRLPLRPHPATQLLHHIHISLRLSPHPHNRLDLKSLDGLAL